MIHYRAGGQEFLGSHIFLPRFAVDEFSIDRDTILFYFLIDSDEGDISLRLITIAKKRMSAAFVHSVMVFIVTSNCIGIAVTYYAVRRLKSKTDKLRRNLG